MPAHSAIPALTLRSYPGAVEQHAHDHHQMVFPLSGAMAMEIASRRERLSGRRAALVRAGAPHRFRGEGDNRFLILDVPLGELPERLTVAAPCFFDLDGAGQHLVGYLAHEIGESRLDPARLRHALALLVPALTRNADLPTAGPLPRALGRALAAARDDERFHSVASLAEAACLSPSQLHLLFRRHLGVSPGRYLAGLRLDRVEAMLDGGGESIAQIAAAAGFADQSALTRAMRRRRGITPAAFRRRG